MGVSLSQERGVAGRAFVRSLNMLLKYVRMYGMRHKRSTDQFDTAWKELQIAVASSAGLLLGVSGSKLLLDGVPLETGPVERAFSDLLQAIGIASIQFMPNVTMEDFDRLVQAFSLAKPQAVLGQLKATLPSGPRAAIRLNEVRYVEDEGHKGDSSVAAQLTATMLEQEKHSGELGNWLNDPHKLLQLIFAAQGADKATDGGLSDSTSGTGGVGSSSTGPLQEGDVITVLGWLRQLGKTEKETDSQTAAAAMQAGLAQLPHNAVIALRQTLAHLAAMPVQSGDQESTLVRLAEHLAIRFALEKYERGEVKVNAVREMLDRMNREVASLRKVLHAHEETMGNAGLTVESHAEILDRQFWASVPEKSKLAVLLSSDAFCIPSKNVRSFVEDAFGRGDKDLAKKVLHTYVKCIRSKEVESRRKTAIGLSDLADLYLKVNDGVLGFAIQQLGVQLPQEAGSDMKSLLAAAFARLTHEANINHDYLAIERSLSALQQFEDLDPVFAQELRPRVAVEGRLREFLGDAISSEGIPAGLVEVLRRMPRPTVEQVLSRFAASIRRKECERLIELLVQMGDPALEHLRVMFRTRPAAEAVLSVGALSRMDFSTLHQELPKMIPGWARIHQDALVRQLSLGAAPQRGPLLIMLLPALDSLIKPLALDEIGISGDQEVVPELLKFLEVTASAEAPGYLTVKAIEALGRLYEPSAADVLAKMLSARSLLKWKYHREIRIAAAQALRHLNPSLAQQALDCAGLDAEDLQLAPLETSYTEWSRSRRYARVKPSRGLSARLQTSKGRTNVSLVWLGLGGGVATCEPRTAAVYESTLELQVGLRRLRPQVLVRANRSRELTFEFVNMDLEERSALRRMISELLRHQGTSPGAQTDGTQNSVTAALTGKF